MRRHLVPLAAAILAAAPALSTAARAQTPGETASVRVRVADLDLQSRAGAQAALQRLRHAADAVCGGEPNPRELGRHQAYEACVHGAVDRTVAESRSPMLADLNGTPLRTGALAAAN